MDLPIDIITMDSLMKRWNMSFDDIVLTVVNHDLFPLIKKHPNSEWEKITDLDYDVLAPFYQPNADASKIVFLRSDVKQIEEKYGDPVTKSPEIIHENDLVKRLGISKLELWHLQEARSIDLYDPLGLRIDDIEIIKSVPQLIPGGGAVKYYFSLSDVEKLETELGIEPKKLKDKKEPKLRPSQRHRIQCREIAEQLWKENPEITIIDMIMSDEIAAACDGEIYTEKAIRNWIKDLCPNRSPGRRPKKK